MAFTSLTNAAEEIRSRCNIVDVVSPLVQIKKAGSLYKGCCPFHKEKTPSFFVSEKKQTFTCYGCQKHGDVFSFVQEYYNIGFADAVRKLAAQYGVEISDAYERTGKKKEPYFALNAAAARFFFDALTKRANKGYDYMKSRGIQPEIITKFGIGYADEEWQTLTDFLVSQGGDVNLIAELGLCSKSDKNGRLYDRFRGRVMFPIFNVTGKVIGFGGRTIIGDDAKYLNSPESFIFEKKRNLYGLHLSKSEIQEKGYAILVEGYMDVIGLYQGGVRNVCAALGTSFTPEQASLLKRYTKKVVLCLDSDAAGIKAALRACDILREAGIDVRVMHVDDGKDPDEYIRKHGADEFRAHLEKTAQTDIDFKISLIARKYDVNDLTQGIRFLRAAADVLRPLSPVEADLYTRKVAQMSGVSEGALRREIETPDAGRPQAPTQGRPKEDGAKSDGDIEVSASGRLQLERILIKLCMQRSDFWEKLSQYEEAFCTADGFRIAEVFAALHQENKDFDAQTMHAYLEASASAYLDNILDTVVTGDEDSAFEDCIKRLDRRRAASRMKQIMDILSIAEGESEETQNALLRELAELQKMSIG